MPPHRLAAGQAGPVLVLPLLLSLLLAGCAGAGGDGEGGDGPGIRSATTRKGDGEDGGGLPTIAMPEWRVGDAWTYTLNGMEEATYVITSETATDWIMETDSAERSFANERDDVSRLGPQRKSDLAGSQGDERVEYFRWPLADGVAWRTTWDHQPVTIGALVQPDHADLTATDEAGNLVYRYSYDAKNRWFTELHHYAPDGSEVVSLVLKQAVRGWSGTVVRWTLDEVIADAGSDPGQPPLVGGPFEVAAGATDIWAGYHFVCGGNGGYTVAVEPANPGLAGQQGKVQSGQCTDVAFADVLVAGPHPGSWTFAVSAGGQTIAYDFAIVVRTRQDVPFGA